MEARLDNFKELKLKLDGLVPPAMASVATCYSMRFIVRFPVIRR